MMYIDWWLLDDVVDDDGDGSEEVGVVDFGVKEDFGCEEVFVIDVDGYLVVIGVGNNVLCEMVMIMVVFGKFFDDVRVDIIVWFFDFLCGFERRVGFVMVMEERLDEVGDVVISNWDWFDGGVNDIVFCDRDDVSDIVIRVNDCIS